MITFSIDDDAFIVQSFSSFLCGMMEFVLTTFAAVFVNIVVEIEVVVEDVF